MSTGDILHPPGGSPPFSPEQASTEDEHPTHESLPCDEWSLVPLLPRMRAVLDELNKTDLPSSAGFSFSPPGSRSATTLLDTLGNNVLRLQEAFTESLYDGLNRWDIDASVKLTLRLDDEARLRLEGGHPEQDRIEEMLAGRPEYSAMFAEIAVQSAALRDLKNLWMLAMFDSVRDSYAALAAGALNSHYQISLKGEMNHFYFAR